MSDLKAGKSLADIASSKGISKDTLISKLNASMKTRLDKAVSNGKLTAAKEKDILTKSQTRITKMVEQKGLPKFGGKHGMHGMRGGGLMKDAASILKVDQKTLMSDLKAGKSLADIASSKGISKDTLISKLNASMKTRLDKAVSNGKMTAAQEKDMLTKNQSRVSDMVTQKGFPKGGMKPQGGMHHSDNDKQQTFQ